MKLFNTGYLGIVFCLGLFLSIPNVYAAEGAPEPVPVLCDDANSEIGKLFYDFDRIVVYYPRYGDLMDNKLPEPLNYKNLNDRVQRIIDKNFTECLKTGFFGKKDIIAIADIERTAQSATRTGELFKQILDPKSLTYVIEISYVRQIGLAISTRAMVQLRMGLSRAGVFNTLTRPLGDAVFRQCTFFLQYGQADKDLEGWLDKCLSQYIRPYRGMTREEAMQFSDVSNAKPVENK